jgi:uncharacterized LabA/DUF88 family protein
MGKQRVYAYVDGFNLFYGALKGTPYKWLDITRLCESLLRPYAQLEKVKYFSAILSRSKDPNKEARQKTYIDAINTDPKVEITLGFFTYREVSLFSARHYKKGKYQLLDVMKPEEKGTDVNLAVHMVADAFQDKFDYAMLFSNDSDMAEAMRIVSKVCGKKVGLYLPQDSITMRILFEKAVTIRRLKNRDLKQNQLPDEIKTESRTIRKPIDWQRVIDE